MWVILAFIMLMICFVRCKETVHIEAQESKDSKVSLGKSLKALLGNQYFWACLILWMSIPYCVSAIALFTVPQTQGSLQFWYIFITYNLTTTVFYTAINVPYGTLSTMMTRSSHERDMLSIFRMSLAPIGRIIAVTFTQPVVKLFGDDQAAWVRP